MLKIPDFTKQEINYFLDSCNFTSQEKELFLLRNEEVSLERCAEIMNVGVATVYRINKKMKSKMLRVI